MGSGLRIETGAERTTIIVDIFDIIQQVRDTSIHLKVLILIFVFVLLLVLISVLIDQEPKSSRGPQI